jgi:hypothetical protein
VLTRQENARVATGAIIKGSGDREGDWKSLKDACDRWRCIKRAELGRFQGTAACDISGENEHLDFTVNVCMCNCNGLALCSTATSPFPSSLTRNTTCRQRALSSDLEPQPHCPMSAPQPASALEQRIYDLLRPFRNECYEEIDPVDQVAATNRAIKLERIVIVLARMCQTPSHLRH